MLRLHNITRVTADGVVPHSTIDIENGKITAVYDTLLPYSPDVMVYDAGVPLWEAVKMASTTPARVIGLGDQKGALRKGYDADVVLLDNELHVRDVIARGTFIER